MIQLTVNAETADQFFKSLAAIGGKQTLAGIGTEALLDELRDRMASQGHTVNIDPVAMPAGEPPQSESPKRGPGRPRKPAEAKAEPEPEKPDPDQGMAIPPRSTALSRDDVIAALNTYSASRGGQTAGRTKMQEVCGVTRLQDIKPEDYAKLIEALQAAA
jgi:hypothetical protein